MKKSTFSKYVAILLFITMLTLIALAGTYAKYTSSFEGGGTATTADWNITVNGEEPGWVDEFFTITEKIYPGCYYSNVVNLTIRNDSSNLQARINRIEFQILNSELKNVAMYTNTFDGPTIDPGDSIELPVTLCWLYTDDDETDYNNTEIEVDVTVEVEQVNT